MYEPFIKGSEFVDYVPGNVNTHKNYGVEFSCTDKWWNGIRLVTLFRVADKAKYGGREYAKLDRKSTRLNSSH